MDSREYFDKLKEDEFLKSLLKRAKQYLRAGFETESSDEILIRLKIYQRLRDMVYAR